MAPLQNYIAMDRMDQPTNKSIGTEEPKLLVGELDGHHILRLVELKNIFWSLLFWFDIIVVLSDIVMPGPCTRAPYPSEFRGPTDQLG